MEFLFYENRNDFSFPIVKFPFLHIPWAPAYGVHASKLVRYFTDCHEYQDFVDGGKLLSSNCRHRVIAEQSL